MLVVLPNPLKPVFGDDDTTPPNSVLPVFVGCPNNVPDWLVAGAGASKPPPNDVVPAPNPGPVAAGAVATKRLVVCCPNGFAAPNGAVVFATGPPIPQ